MSTLSTAPEGSVRYPWGLIAIAATIPLISVMMVSSAGRELFPDLWYKQLLWGCAGFLAGAIVSRLRSTTLELASYPIYAITCFLLVAVLVIGTPHQGAQRWLDIGPLGGQPSELAKIAIVLVTARYFAEYEVPGGYTLMQLLRPMNVSRPVVLALGTIWRHFHQIKKHDLDIIKNVPVEEIHKLQPHMV
ncbi:MAG TPA: FtsW/RodA/SpoVE family cell cycle protein, partial [Myxococcota bacterium]